MLRFRRCFSASRNILQNLPKDQGKLYSRLFTQPYFHQIKEKLNTTNINELEPYDLSKKVADVVKDLGFSKQEAAVVHNKLIEELTQHSFGVATIHSKILKELDEKISMEALLEIVKHNPGRITSSWELFANYTKEAKETPDELLSTVLSKIVNFDSADIKDGKKVMSVSDITEACYILESLNNKELTSKPLINKIANAALRTEATFLLPLILKYQPDIEIFSNEFDHLSPLQLYAIFNAYSFEVLRTFPKFVYDIVGATGRPDTLVLSEEETEAKTAIDSALTTINSSLGKVWKPALPEVDPQQAEKNFFRILDDLESGNIIQKDFNLVKMTLRILSLTKCNIEEFMELYVKVNSSFPDKQDEFAFEAYLAYSYMAFKSGDASFLQAAKNWLPKKSASNSIKLNVLRTNIITTAKFNIDKSLEIFNANIQSMDKIKPQDKPVSEADLLTESLILAYLYNEDIDFSRTLLEKGMSEKLFSGKPAVKRIKKHFAGYGEAAENKELVSFIQKDASSFLEGL